MLIDMHAILCVGLLLGLTSENVEAGVWVRAETRPQSDVVAVRDQSSGETVAEGDTNMDY